jgi:hypothetical protein
MIEWRRCLLTSRDAELRDIEEKLATEAETLVD